MPSPARANSMRTEAWLDKMRLLIGNGLVVSLLARTIQVLAAMDDTKLRQVW